MGPCSPELLRFHAYPHTPRGCIQQPHFSPVEGAAWAVVFVSIIELCMAADVCRAVVRFSGSCMQGARKLAAAALHHRFHDNLARMFCALGSLGAAEALLLPGAPLRLSAWNDAAQTHAYSNSLDQDRT